MRGYHCNKLIERKRMFHMGLLTIKCSTNSPIRIDSNKKYMKITFEMKKDNSNLLLNFFQHFFQKNFDLKKNSFREKFPTLLANFSESEMERFRHGQLR
jgi:hypothetical protein